jgi:hypothetical protein
VVQRLTAVKTLSKERMICIFRMDGKFTALISERHDISQYYNCGIFVLKSSVYYKL